MPTFVNGASSAFNRLLLLIFTHLINVDRTPLGTEVIQWSRDSDFGVTRESVDMPKFLVVAAKCLVKNLLMRTICLST